MKTLGFVLPLEGARAHSNDATSGNAVASRGVEGTPSLHRLVEHALAALEDETDLEVSSGGGLGGVSFRKIAGNCTGGGSKSCLEAARVALAAATT
mmetsp:Transcript_75386/g.140619  ORF Transcript_75386/g.140619 Transcript_75386/m.140619 type:complete len:96 (-) Transcript_75386:904-1191(-)